MRGRKLPIFLLFTKLRTYTHTTNYTHIFLPRRRRRRPSKKEHWRTGTAFRDDGNNSSVVTKRFRIFQNSQTSISHTSSYAPDSSLSCRVQRLYKSSAGNI